MPDTKINFGCYPVTRLLFELMRYLSYVRQSSKRVGNREVAAPNRGHTILLLVAASLVLTLAGWTQTPREALLTADNAYNPIPSPDGRYIAYVRTGWGRPGGSGGFGRSNLVSELTVIDENGVPVTVMSLADMFLGGWTPNGNDLVCFRDWEYALVSKDGKRVMEGRIPNDPNKRPATEWVAYSLSLAAIVWSRLIDNSYGAIETPETPGPRTVVREKVFRNRVIPSPDGRYLAVFGEFPQTDLRVYDLRLESWTDLGTISDPSGYNDSRRNELEPGADDWTLLFQVDSDDDARMMWGDAGMLYVWIRRQDLETQSFDKAWTILQCF